ncbi:hypothetical protein ES708_08781 [subsurface metagenome]
MLSSIPAIMLKCSPEIASRWAVPVVMKSSLTSAGMLYLMPRSTPWVSAACGSGITSAMLSDRLFLNE